MPTSNSNVEESPLDRALNGTRTAADGVPAADKEEEGLSLSSLAAQIPSFIEEFDFEAASKRPTVIGAGRRGRFRGGQMPLADGVGVIAMLQENLGEEAIFKGNVAIATRIARRAFGDAGHAIGVVVAPGEHTRARGRTERGGVHVVIAQAVGGEGIKVGGVDGTAITA